ncbi:MAG: glyoxylase-like metal-dependent hydrolase (beta-lactamase superfamily II) [Thermoproteota archaeon]
MRVHHLNCGTFCPITGPGIIKRIPLIEKYATLVCHVLLIETDNDGLILVDTGLGVKDVTKTERPLSNLFSKSFLKPILDIKYTALHQVIELGFNPRDVKHIIATHLDYDHVGGLADFPWATVHLLENEYFEAFEKGSLKDNPSFENLKSKTRYLAEQFSHGVNFEVHQMSGEKWNGFDSVGQIKGLPPEILLIPLPGHTKGHTGVSIQTSSSNYLFVGDAYLSRSQLLRKKTPTYVNLYNKLFQTDMNLFEENLERLSQLQEHGGEKPGKIEIFCSHDRTEFECMCHGNHLDS